MSAPTTMSPRDQAQDAFEVHSTLLIAEVTFPNLRENPRWQMLRMDAFEDFHNLLTTRLRDGN